MPEPSARHRFTDRVAVISGAASGIGRATAQRLVQEEQAAAIAFLASDEASYINGVSLDVNGGLYMA